MIEIKNLSKTFPSADGSVEALKNVSLSIPDGDIFGIIGNKLIIIFNSCDIFVFGSF